MMRQERARQGTAARKGARTGRSSCLTSRSDTRPALIARRELRLVRRDMVLDTRLPSSPLEWCSLTYLGRGGGSESQ